MQSQEHAYAYHAALPADCPRHGWTRQEVREATEVRDIVKQLEAVMKGYGYPRKDSFAVGLALLEAAANALTHGNRGDKTRTALITYHVTRAQALIEVADEGFGFDPCSVPNPLEEDKKSVRSCGRGLMLMRLYMSWVRFNERGNRVVLCKRRSAV
jgi:serine/threonine-protein kinase RsbW